MPDVTVILPAYNEDKAIAKVIDDVRTAMNGTGRSYEVMVVDDASSDRTADIAAEKGATVIRRKERGGSGASRKTGILATRSPIIVMLDADGTYDAASIPKLLAEMPTYDQVNGARTSEEGTLKPLRFAAKWFIRKIASIMVNRAIPDLNTGLKAFKRDIMLRYLWMIPDGFSCVTSMTLCFLANGHAVKYVKTPYYPRVGISKFHPIRDTYLYGQTVIRIVMYFNPLRVFLPLFLVVLLGGIFKTAVDWFSIRRMQASDIVILSIAFVILAIGLLADVMVSIAKQITYTHFDLEAAGRGPHGDVRGT